MNLCHFYKEKVNNLKPVFLPCKINWATKSEFMQYIKDIPVTNKILFVAGEAVTQNLGLNELFKNMTQTHDCNRITKGKDIPIIEEIHHILSHIVTKPDIIVAIGGGSAIDIAKMISAFWYLRDKSRSIQDIVTSINEKEYKRKESNIQIVAAPTTAGTGSEVTSWATLWDTNNCKKYSIDAKYLYPTTVFIVPEFTVAMSDKLTLATGLDALCHATESYWAKDSNVVTRELSKSAISIIIKYLPKVLEDKKNLYYREKMCLGSLYAGLAFSQTRTTACHSISYPLTMKFGVEHGFACAMTLVEIFKLNYDYVIEPDELLLAFGMNNINEIDKWLTITSKGIIHLRLETFNIKDKDIILLAQMSFTQGRMDNNPALIEKEEVVEILKKIK
jgi:alcohol dehydrogenase class IV